MSPTMQVAAARAAFDTGRTKPSVWRVRQLQALIRLVQERGGELEAALAADLGKPPVETLVTETAGVLTEARYALKHLKRWMRDRRVPAPLPLQPASAWIHREPLGVVLVVAPWNYPVLLLLSPLVGALAAGNAVVLKPSEVAAATSAALARLVPQYLDADAVRVVEGGVTETTELLEQRFDHIFYTGNGAVGRIVMAAAAKHLTPVTLELGGKSPTWVDPSADLGSAARWIAWGKFLNTGQTCIAPDYVLTTPAVASRLVPLLEGEIGRLYGPDARASADYGRIVTERHADRLIGLLDSGRVAVGGVHDREARFVAPTVLTGVGLDDPVMREEIFGPVLPIVEVAGLDEAIRVINRRDKPLALYSFGGDDAVRRRILAETSSGSVAFDAALVQVGVPALPFGGVGASGTGSYHGEASMRTFSHERSVVRKRRGPDLLGFARAPYTAKKERSLRRSMG